MSGNDFRGIEGSLRSLARLVEVVGIGLVLAISGGGCGEQPVSCPSIVLVSLDTLRADHLSVYGYQRETSPVLDRFASEAIRFEEALAQAPGTLTSHLSLFTSLYPPQFGITRRDGRNWNQAVTTLRLRDSVVTLAEILREHGYRTIAFTDGGAVSPRYGFDQGFELYRVIPRLVGKGKRLRIHSSIAELDGLLGKHENDEQPFFLFIHTYHIHSPYQSPPPFDRYFTSISSLALGGQRQFLINPARNKRAEAHADLVRGFYDNGIRATDDSLRDLFDLLRRRGLYESSVIVVLSDHGEEFLDHGGFGHGGRLHQEHLLVPLLIRLPGGRRGGTVLPGPVGLVDVAPTLIELAGLEVPDQFRGRSLKRLLEGTDAGTWLAERRLYSDIPNVRSGLRSLRRGRWKLIESPWEQRVELYDLEVDPEETVNLAEDRTEILGQLRGELTDWVSEMEDRAQRDGTLAVDTNEPLSSEHREQLRELGYLR